MILHELILKIAKMANNRTAASIAKTSRLLRANTASNMKMREKRVFLINLRNTVKLQSRGGNTISAAQKRQNLFNRANQLGINKTSRDMRMLIRLRKIRG